MSYQIFLDVLNQLENDQSFFEAELGQELQGIRHEELVRLGMLIYIHIYMLIYRI